MRLPLLVALLALLVLALGACADDTDDAAPDEAAEEERLDELELQETPDLGEPVDLDEGVAATVDGSTIEVATVEGRFDAVARVPEVAELLDGEDGEAAAEFYRAHIVQNLILQRIIADGAAELGVEPDEEDVAAVEEQAIADFGGDRDEWDQALEAEGVTEEQREEEFRFAARVEAIRQEVADDVDEAELPAGDELDLDLSELALQQWFGERLAQAEVEVDQEYGIWVPHSGEVVPAGMLDDAG